MLAGGGSAVVYLAQDEHASRPVALKVCYVVNLRPQSVQCQRSSLVFLHWPAQVMDFTRAMKSMYKNVKREVGLHAGVSA